MPNTAIACGNSKATSTQKECAKEKMASKDAEKMDCCSKKSKEDKKGCDGKCGQSVCATSSGSGVAFLNFETIVPIRILNFSFEKEKIYTTVETLSDGYSSLWLIPKIG